MKVVNKLSAAGLTLAHFAGAHATFQARQKNATEKPSLKLPWGTYEGEIFPNDENIYLFQNVRYGVIPERFSAPTFPNDTNSSVQSPSDGRNCISVKDKQDAISGTISYVGDGEETEAEDCLFLDVYVPKSVFEEPPSKLLPVVTWFHGGGFVAGNKNSPNGTYTGQPMLRESNYSLIYVAANYRLGAYGWLAGDYMEKNGQPNAGLYDQALVFEWVQEHIDKVYGDKSQVTANGESAGASSIVHHLIRENGQRDPLFTRFAVQSPAFKWSWDNSPNGMMDQLYQNVSNYTECGLNFDIACLRKSTKLADANQAAGNSSLFPFGPAVDGKWVTTIPSVAFSQGHYWKNINSTIISHTGNELPSLSMTNYVPDEPAFLNLLNITFPGDRYKSERDDIIRTYDCEKDYGGNYPACAAAVIGDFAIYCNARDVLEAYPAQSHLTRYEFPIDSLAPHSKDLYAFFANNLAELLVDRNTSAAYQRYFASFALTGNPSALDPPPIPYGAAPKWPVAKDACDVPSNVLKVRAPLGVPAFALGTDDQLSRTTCEFWDKLAKEVVAP